MESLISFILLSALIGEVPALSANGAIRVTVIDQSGHPVSGATVRFDQRTERVLGVVPECVTDAAGVCTRRNLRLDSFTVSAKKKADGYPDTSFDLYRNDRTPVVTTLTAQHPDSEVVVTVGPKAAILLLHPLDETSRDHILSYQVILRDAKNAKEFVGIGVSQDSLVLVPPNKNVVVEVIANGYKTWSSSDHTESMKDGVLYLRSEEKVELTIFLRRAHHS